MFLRSKENVIKTKDLRGKFTKTINKKKNIIYRQNTADKKEISGSVSSVSIKFKG